MNALLQVYAFVKAQFSRILSLRYGPRRSKIDKNVCSVSDLTTDTKPAGSVSQDSIVPDPALFLELVPTIEPSVSDLIGAAVALNLTLPSLPSILTKPKARPAIEDEDASLQDFGRPSNVFHDRRLPLGTITNIPQVDKVNTKTKTKAVGPTTTDWSSPTGGSRGRRSRTKRPCLVHVEVKATPEAQDPSSMAVAPTSVIVSSFADAAPIAAAAAPGSDEWNSNKSALLLQVRSWTEQVKASRRQSMPVPSIPAPPPATVIPASAPISSKRHSAPPVLVASSKAPRLDLQDLLRSLIEEAQDTIAALGAANVSGELGAGKDERMPTFSAVALENGPIFVIGDDEDDEDVEPITASPHRRSQDARSLPTVNPMASIPNSGLISSISASRSMAALANAGSRSISDLLASFDEVLASPRWRRLLSRSHDIARRNDSVV
ncbi:hypothetical protein C8R44DRAFT_868515 [Mycena epipterygia]|nr:hypothetical protein C8R44DRAFT_868515 [Mycena epipterygia]